MTLAELIRIPGGLLPGLLDEWFGRVAWADETLVLVGDTLYDCKDAPFPVNCTADGSIRLPLERPECRDWLIRWAIEGARCAACHKGHGQVPTNGYHLGGDGLTPKGEWRNCRPCNGTGYQIGPHVLNWTRDQSKSAVTGKISAALLGASARWLAMEGEPLRGLLGEWYVTDTFHGWGRRRIVAGDTPANMYRPELGSDRNWWYVKIADGHPYGPWPAQHDAKALKHRWALLNPGELIVPVPDGSVIVPLTEKITVTPPEAP